MAEEPVLNEAPGPGMGQEKKPHLPVSILAGGIFAVAVLAGLFWLSRRPPAQQAPPLSDAALAYSEQIKVADLHLSAEGNFLGQDVVYVDGKVTNQGSKPVQQLRVRLYFYDTLSQIILREEQDIIRSSSTPLGPGETRDFQLRFDRIPPSWNLQLPQFQLVSLQLE